MAQSESFRNSSPDARFWVPSQQGPDYQNSQTQYLQAEAYPEIPGQYQLQSSNYYESNLQAQGFPPSPQIDNPAQNDGAVGGYPASLLPHGYNWEKEWPQAGGTYGYPSQPEQNGGWQLGGNQPGTTYGDAGSGGAINANSQFSQQLLMQLAQSDPTFASAIADAAPSLSSQGLLSLELSALSNSNSNNPLSDTTLLTNALQSSQFSESDAAAVQNILLPELQISQPQENISASGIDQSSYGDCVFEASLAAVAKTAGGQSLIQQMITPNPDGSYTVTFPGDSSNPVTVTQADLQKEHTKDSAPWANILETAMLQNYPALSKGTTPKDAPGGTDGQPPSPAQYALYLLTGNTATKTDASSADIGSKLEQAMANDQPVTAFCKDNDNGALVDGHEWTVENYNAQSKTITLRNPWGSTPSSDVAKSGITTLGDGQVQMSLSTFQKYYAETTFANTKTNSDSDSSSASVST